MRYYSILFFFLLPCLPVSTVLAQAQTPQAAFEAANALYQKGNFEQAAAQYEALRQSGQRSAALEIHLGDAYFRLRQLGKAIVQYRRALQLDPANSEARQNLEAAKTHIVQVTETFEPFFLTRMVRAIRSSLTAKNWSIVAIVALWLTMMGAVTWLFGLDRTWKKRGFIAAMVFVALSALAYLSANNAASVEQDKSIGIITIAQTTLRIAPDEVAKSIGILHEGEPIKVLETVGGWYKVLIANGEQGWLPKESSTLVVENN